MTDDAKQRIEDAQGRLVAAARDVDRDNPQLLLTNTGASCFLFLSLVRRWLGPEWHFVGKTTRDQARVTPPGMLPQQIFGAQVVGVSHDALFWMPSPPLKGVGRGAAQFDVIGSANYWDGPYHDPETGRQVTARVSGEFIPPEHYREWNPPVSAEQAGEDGAPPPPIPSAPRAIEFPPRDLALEALRALDHFYRERGRPGLYTREQLEGVYQLGRNEHDQPQSDLRGIPARNYVDDEGLAVWFGDYLRRYATGDHAPATSDARERHAASLAQVLADVSRAWPR